jgi:hypothetical protein
MSKKVWMYLALGLVAYGGYMVYAKMQKDKMKLSDIKK